MGADIHLRQPTSGDHSRMVEIENLCFTEIRRFDPAYYSRVCNQFTPSLVAEIDGVVVGFAICRTTSNEEVYLETLNVHPDFRGRGIAKYLLIALEKTFAGANISKMSLHVDVNNRAAIGLYVRMGYSVHERVACYYRDKGDAFVMFKQFNCSSSDTNNSRNSSA